MTELNDNTKIKLESAVVAVEEREVSTVNAFQAMPKWKRVLTLSLLIAAIPLYLVARIGVEQYLLYQWQDLALISKPSFAEALPPQIGSLKIIRNPNGLYSAYVEIANLNLELSAKTITYNASFKDNSGNVVQTSNGLFHLLPDERKFLVIPRIDSPAPIVSGEIQLGEVNWQKKADIPEVNIRISDPYLYEEVNPLSFIVEGSIINQSPYTLGTVRIAFVLYDKSDKIIAVSQREEYKVSAYGRRAYKQVWPGVYAKEVAKVRVIPYTNSIDPDNLTLDNFNE